MSALEALREEVKLEVENADAKTLRLVRAMLQAAQEGDEEEDTWQEYPDHTAGFYPLPGYVLEDIKTAQAQIREGKFTTHEVMMEKLRAWRIR